MTTQKGTTRVLLPDRVTDADYDDTESAVAYDETLADELLQAARQCQDEHAELTPGRPSLSGQGYAFPTRLVPRSRRAG